jgi:hypothetical protein
VKSIKKSRLTGSRNKRRDAAARAAVQCVDGLGDCYERLAALTGLLEACGEPMEAAQVKSAGSLMAEQVRRLAELTDTLDNTLRRL